MRELRDSFERHGNLAGRRRSCFGSEGAQICPHEPIKLISNRRVLGSGRQPIQEGLQLGVAQRCHRRHGDQRRDLAPCHLPFSLREGSPPHGAHQLVTTAATTLASARTVQASLREFVSCQFFSRPISSPSHLGSITGLGQGHSHLPGNCGRKLSWLWKPEWQVERLLGIPWSSLNLNEERSLARSARSGLPVALGSSSRGLDS